MMGSADGQTSRWRSMALGFIQKRLSMVHVSRAAQGLPSPGTSPLTPQSTSAPLPTLCTWEEGRTEHHPLEQCFPNQSCRHCYIAEERATLLS